MILEAASYNIDITTTDLLTKITRESKQRFPLVSWNFFIESFQETSMRLKKESEISFLISLSEKYKWKNDLKQLFLENDYEALVLTDEQQKIVWVNDGFTDMTGYPKNFAINKNPKFLQGEATSKFDNSNIKNKLINNEVFSGVIINYKKDNTIYKCEVKIIPLYNNDTTHYLAFEREVV